MKWQGRTGLLVGVALVVAAGMVMPGKKKENMNEAGPPVEALAAGEHVEPKAAVPVSRPAREGAPGFRP